MSDENCLHNTILENIVSIHNDIITQLEPISFKGKIYIYESQDDISYPIKEINKKLTIGFDTESRPAFIKGQKFPISLIQIATYEEVYLFKIKNKVITQDLINIINNKNITKLSIGISNDIKKLKELSRKVEPRNFIDLSSIAKGKGLIQTSAKALAAKYLNKHLIKSSQITNWSKKTLSDKQILYAATDAWLMLDLYQCLLDDSNIYNLDLK